MPRSSGHERREQAEAALGQDGVEEVLVGERDRDRVGHPDDHVAGDLEPPQPVRPDERHEVREQRGERGAQPGYLAQAREPELLEAGERALVGRGRRLVAPLRIPGGEELAQRAGPVDGDEPRDERRRDVGRRVAEDRRRPSAASSPRTSSSASATVGPASARAATRPPIPSTSRAGAALEPPSHERARDRLRDRLGRRVGLDDAHDRARPPRPRPRRRRPPSGRRRAARDPARAAPRPARPRARPPAARRPPARRRTSPRGTWTATRRPERVCQLEVIGPSSIARCGVLPSLADDIGSSRRRRCGRWGPVATGGTRQHAVRRGAPAVDPVRAAQGGADARRPHGRRPLPEPRAGRRARQRRLPQPRRPRARTTCWASGCSASPPSAARRRPGLPRGLPEPGGDLRAAWAATSSTSAGCATRRCPRSSSAGRPRSTGARTTSSASPRPSSRTSPSLALARRIKERHPGVVTVFGGANFDGEMGPEYVRAFPVDRLRRRRRGGRGAAARSSSASPRRERRRRCPASPARIGNGAWSTGRGAAPRRATSTTLPDPDYDDFFATLMRLGRERVLGDATPLLLFESARGCWWGEKHHCTFCGLNAQRWRSARSRPSASTTSCAASPARYQIVNFEAVDNILDMRYLGGALPPAGRGALRLHSSSTRSRRTSRAPSCARCADAGVSVDPARHREPQHARPPADAQGHDDAAATSALLKWAHYYGITVALEPALRLPRRDARGLRAAGAAHAALVHLQPPAGCGPIWMERFSPYFADPQFPVPPSNSNGPRISMNLMNDGLGLASW